MIFIWLLLSDGKQVVKLRGEIDGMAFFIDIHLHMNTLDRKENILQNRNDMFRKHVGNGF